METHEAQSTASSVPRRPAADWRAILRELGITPSRGLGQNFLVDGEVLVEIVAAACVRAGQTVVEVGPGLGILTAALADAVGPGGRVVSVELDKRLAAYLPTQFVGEPHVRVMQGDILRQSPHALTDGGPYDVVANLPYTITSAAFRFFLEDPHPPGRMTVLLQREVAERIVAAPGEMSILAVSVQFFGVPAIVREVPPEAFVPRPAVTSAVLTHTRREPPLPRERWRGFFALVQAGFGAKRKQIHNSLVERLRAPKEGIAAALAHAGIDGMRRAQTLTMDEWFALDAAFAALDVPLTGAMGRKVAEAAKEDAGDAPHDADG